MKYALLSSIGGEPIEAREADYEHYKGFLKCPACGQSVFLRKEHDRAKTHVSSAFIHHKAIPEVSICEFRVGRYSREDVERLSTVARGQRLSKLRVSLWKYLKTNMALDLKGWSVLVKQVKDNDMGKVIANFASEFMQINRDFMVNDTLSRLQSLLINQDKMVGVSPEAQHFFDAFIHINKYHWELHYKISKEMLEAFLDNPDFEMIRNRLYYCLCHPEIFASMPGILDPSLTEDDFLRIFGAFLTLEIGLIFLTINWVEIFKQ